MMNITEFDDKMRIIKKTGQYPVFFFIMNHKK